MTTEYLYLNDERTEILFTTRNRPAEFENQTPCILIHTDTEQDMDFILDQIENLN